MNKSKHLYHCPLYFDIGFCQKSIRREINFIVNCFKKHQKYSTLSSILDNGCGTGVYLKEFAKLGIEVGGYDLSSEMVQYTRARLAQITNRFHVFKADLRNFKTKHKYDMAICMGGSFQYLLTVKDIIDHLRCVANALNEQGLYLISLPSPEDFFKEPPGTIKSKWSETRDNITVAVNWTYRQNLFDWNTQTFSGLAKIKINDRGREIFLEMPYRYRILFPQEIIALVRLSSCFEIEHIYGDFHLGRTYGKMRAAPDMDVLLRKVRSRR